MKHPNVEAIGPHGIVVVRNDHPTWKWCVRVHSDDPVAIEVGKMLENSFSKRSDAIHYASGCGKGDPWPRLEGEARVRLVEKQRILTDKKEGV